MKFKYDEPRSPDRNPKQAPEYVPEKILYRYTVLKTLGLMMAYHAVSWLFFCFFWSGPMSAPEPHMGTYVSLFIPALGMIVGMGVFFAIIYSKDGDRKRAYLAATSAEVRGAENVAEGVSRYRKLAFTESLVCTAATAGLWMIPSLLYTVFQLASGQGYGYDKAYFFEDFFIGFIGLCEVFQNAWIGMLLGLAILFVFHYFGRLRAHRKWEANRIRR